MAIINRLPHRSAGTVLPRVIVKNGVLLQPNDTNNTDLTTNDASTGLYFTVNRTISGCAYFRVPVDLTEYSTLTMVCTGRSKYTSDKVPVLGVYHTGVYAISGSQDNFGNVGKYVMIANNTNAFSNKTVTLDVSDQTGIQFVNIVIGQTSSITGNLHIQDLYLS